MDTTISAKISTLDLTSVVVFLSNYSDRQRTWG